jgi:arylsulfatase A-like enzyme
MATAAGTTALVHGVAHGALGAAKRPIVLFIYADDLGYGDLSCYGRPDYDTPVLDRLAGQGTKLTSAYAAAPVCTPTRCAF